MKKVSEESVDSGKLNFVLLTLCIVSHLTQVIMHLPTFSISPDSFDRIFCVYCVVDCCYTGAVIATLLN